MQLRHSSKAALLATQLHLVAGRRHLIAAVLTALTIVALQHSLQAATSAGITRSSADRLAAVRPSTVTGKTSSGFGGNPHRLPIIADRSRRHFSSPSSSTPLPHGRAHQHQLPGRYWCSSQPRPLHFYISTIRTYNSQCYRQTYTILEFYFTKCSFSQHSVFSFFSASKSNTTHFGF
jgi:hypothetical protein